MSVAQYQSHAEQMEAARSEFAPWWDQELKTARIQLLNNYQRCEYQVTAWRAFLQAKGLLK